MTKKISRRHFLRQSILSFGALSVPVALTACHGDSHHDSTEPAQFLHGVASGDPLTDRIILWTRVTPVSLQARLHVQWEIASDEQFQKIHDQGVVQTSHAQDFTVKVDAKHLNAGQRYFYRFRVGSSQSPVGKTKTLPSNTSQVKFAVCSCANYPAGYFSVYREMAKHDLDAVIHLGDYLYEYGNNGYASEDAEKIGRTLAEDNQQEILTLEDYRKRYALYRSDVDLQTLHQNHPFIAVWDDHELANDAWKEGAENHQDNEGSFFDRKLAALQAYFEWMPIRPAHDNDFLNIYRQFQFGSLLNLIMLDTRILARDRQLDYEQYVTRTGLNIPEFEKDVLNPLRTMMGVQQRDWLFAQLQQSQATWQVLGQQVLMTKMWIPAELLLALVQADQTRLMQLIPELIQLKQRVLQNDPTLTAQERARVTTVLPYNLDAWDGYAAEREMLYEVLKQLQKKLVVFAGDTHNAWASFLHSADQTVVGVELATSSVTSPGMESYLKIPSAQVQQFEYAFTSLIDELLYCNLNQRGYLLVGFDHQQVSAEWIFVDTVKEKAYKVDQNRQHQLTFDTQLQLIQSKLQAA